MAKIKCPNCGHLNPEGSSNCENCYANISFMSGPCQLPTTDIHRGDYLETLGGIAAVLAVVAIGSWVVGDSNASFWAVLSSVALPPFLYRVFQRVRWNGVVLPPEGYQAFAKGEYLSGHPKLINPQEAILGVTPEQLYVSTISGRLESLHLLQVTGAHRELEQETDKARTAIGGVFLLFTSRVLLIARTVLGGAAKREWHVVVVAYQQPSGMSAELRFGVGVRRVADRMINVINAAVEDYHVWMRGRVSPRP